MPKRFTNSLKLACGVLIISISLGASPASNPPHAADHLPPAVVRAFVRIDASSCSAGASHRGSGFVWHSPTEVVTALHVVGGCSVIDIYYPGLKQSVQGTLTKLNRGSDLALLSVPNAPQPPVIPQGPGVVPADAQLIAWGYPINARRLLDTRFWIRTSTHKLDFLKPQFEQDLRNVGMPDLTADILLLDVGFLRPGYSGAPLLDSQGRVVGIADGGIEEGTTGVNWAIPASALQNLVPVGSQPAAPLSRSTLVFAAEIDSPAEPFDVDSSLNSVLLASASSPTISCGTRTFEFRHTKRLDEIAATSDDPTGLTQLVAAAGSLLQPTETFDIYQDTLSGATVVLPSGTSMVDQGNLCFVRVHPNVEMYIQVRQAIGPFAIQQQSLAFEHEISSYGFPIPDPIWSNWVPH